MKKYNLFFGLLTLLMLTITIACNNEASTAKSPKQVSTTENNAKDAKGVDQSKRKGMKSGSMPQKTYRVADHSINGVKAGLRMTEMRHVLVRGKVDLGNGKELVMRIRDDKGAILGRVEPRIGNTDLVGDIIITSKKGLTPDGIRVGDTFATLKERIPGIASNISSENGKTFATHNNIKYRLELEKSDNDMDPSKINDETVISEIVLIDKK